MEYSPLLNLQHLSMLQEAINLWDQPLIRRKINDYFHKEYSRRQSEQKKEKWNDLVKEVVEQLSHLLLPPVLKAELVFITQSLGERIFYWSKYAKNMSILSNDHSKKLYWTQFGTIDQVRTVESLCESSGGSNVCSLFQLACNNCLKNHIEALWRHVPREVQDGPFYVEGIYQQSELHLLAYWKFFFDGNLPHLINLLKHMNSENSEFYVQDQSVEENMFRLSVAEGYDAAMKYFWNKLSDEERLRNVVRCALISIKKSNEVVSGNYFSYKNHVYVDILIFLLQGMTVEQRTGLYAAHKSSVLKLLLNTWPWQKLVVYTLEEMWDSFTELDYQSLMHWIMGKLTQDYDLGCPADHSKFQKILHEVWCNSPARLKKNIDKHCWQVLSVLFKIEDILSVTMIINDPDLEDRRSELLAQGKNYFADMIRKGKFELLEECLEGLEFSEEEKDKLKVQIHVDIDYMRSIKQEEYEQVDKYLNWAMKAEDREKLKNSLKSSSFSVSHLCNIWSVPRVDLDDARERASRFLNWLFETEEEQLTFKQNMLNSSELHTKILSKFIPYNHFEIIEPFLEWCLVPMEEILIMKQRIVNETASSTCKLLISGDHLFIVEHFLNWAFKTKDKRQDFVTRFIVSDDGVMASCNLIRRSKSVGVSKQKKIEKFEILLNLFFHTTSIRDEFREKMRLYISYYVGDKNIGDYLLFLDLLDEFEMPQW